MTISFTHYYDYHQLVHTLKLLEANYSKFVSLHVVGHSFEGREILLAVITNKETGPDIDKPGFWLDGNIHAAELVGSSACLYFINYLVTNYSKSPEVRKCLDTRTFYICPRVNPDGAEWALATPPKLIRSGVRPYPNPEQPVEGLKIQDVDNDNRVLTMRIPDPNGAWKISAQEPRLLVPRDPVEQGGQYFRLMPEGMIDNYDGVTVKLQAKRESLDLNRNFPAQWRQEHEQKGAGEYPTSEPEVRAIVDFIVKHPNICAGTAMHSYSGALLRPFSYQADAKFPAEDLWTYQKIGAKGSEITGYPAVSVFHDFSYHPDEVITGALDDWMYEHLGVFAWTVEIWSPQRQAGIKDFKLFDWYREHPFADDVKMLQWSDSALNGKGYIDWYPFKHPQLGDVELGGWNTLFSFWNPPEHLLEKEIALFPDWLVWQCMISPKIEFHSVHATKIAPDTYHIVVAIQNTGWLPSYVTKHAKKNKLVRGAFAEISLPDDARLVSGQTRFELGQLEGRAHKNSSPNGWAGSVEDSSHDRVKAEWVVSAKAKTELTITCWHDRAGKITKSIRL